MGEDNAVNELISKWRDSVREASTSAPDGAPAPRKKRWWVAGIGALVLLGFVVLGVVDTGADQVPVADAGPAVPESSAPPPQPSIPPVADWFDLVQQADAVRGQAYAAADPAGLDTAFDPAGIAWVQEKRRVDELRTAGLQASGWLTTLSSVALLQQEQATARLRVEDQRGAYQLVRTDGASTDVPAAAPAAWLIDLRYRDGAWLIDAVEPDLTNHAARP